MREDIWSSLAEYYEKIRNVPLVALFERDPRRFDDFSIALDDMLLDYSKTALDVEARRLLVRLAETADVAGRRDAMLGGEIVNRTEGRAALHTALRNRSGNPVIVAGEDVMPGINATLDAMRDFADGIRSGRITASDGGGFTDVVNIGIGGSDLGPAMATRALAPYHDGPRLHFVSNIDGAEIADLLKTLEPERTLFIIASKTFTTIETMTNAETAKRWMQRALGARASEHFAAVSTAREKTAAFGIDPARVFGFADWVGGRYSVWGPIGLPLMIAIGPDRFMEFLGGAHEMDRHFAAAPIERNMPFMLALVGIWHNNICGYASRAVLPYDQRLARLPAYLQQLDMESNGKRITDTGEVIARDSGPIVWGEVGTNGQHAFYQLLHQGSRIVPCEFLVAAEGHEADLVHHHALLLANCLAQSEALMTGRSYEEAAARLTPGEMARDDLDLARHKTFPGNRPSTTLLYRRLDPRNLGRILALYEHRVFVEGAIWNINCFDQWGVELGKELAASLQPMIGNAGAARDKDGSTRGLLAAIARLRCG